MLNQFEMKPNDTLHCVSYFCNCNLRIAAYAISQCGIQTINKYTEIQYILYMHAYKTFGDLNLFEIFRIYFLRLPHLKNAVSGRCCTRSRQNEFIE